MIIIFNNKLIIIIEKIILFINEQIKLDKKSIFFNNLSNKSLLNITKHNNEIIYKIILNTKDIYKNFKDFFRKK